MEQTVSLLGTQALWKEFGIATRLDFYPVLYGRRCQKSTFMDESIN